MPQLNNNRHENHSSDEEEAKKILKALLAGVHPKTGEKLHDGSVFSEPEVMRAFHTAIKLFDEKAASGKTAGDGKNNTVVAALRKELPDTKVSRAVCHYNISVTSFIHRIQKVSENAALSLLTPQSFNKWLVEKGYLCNEEKNGNKKKSPTEMGKKIGIVVELSKFPGYRIPTVRLTPEAQKYLLEMFDEIMDYHIRTKTGFDNRNAARNKRALQTEPFKVNEQQLRMILLEEPTGISQFVRNINAVIQNEKMCIPSANEILAWLECVGMLVFTEKEGGGRSRIPTDAGNKQGIVTEVRTADDGTEYQQCLYTIDAQKFLIDHMEEILETRG